MADEVIVYGYCDAKCKHRVLTIDQTVNLIQEMAANGFQVPEGFIPTTAINSIIEQNKGKALRLWVGTQAEYDAWTGDKDNLYAIISDDPTLQKLLDKIIDFEEKFVSVIDGKTVVGNAKIAQYASEDVSKGTIEQRLTNLGFKEGNASVLVNTTSISENYVKRQGNYIIGRLELNDTNQTVHNCEEYEINFIVCRVVKIATMPVNFRPKQRDWFISIINSGNNSSYCHEGFIDIDGNVFIFTDWIGKESPYPATTLEFKRVAFNFGYEANPIN